MRMELTDRQAEKKEEFRAFVDERVAPFADRWDREERIPDAVVRETGETGYPGGVIPVEYGGGGWDMITHGLLCEEIGRGSASLLSMFTVHGMVHRAILQWGSPAQREYWLLRLASGQTLGAFGLTEPRIGSDAKNVKTEAVRSDGGYRLTGQKKWISCGRIADLFLIMAQCDGAPTAFLVERDAPGFSVKPITGMLGFRSAMLAELTMDGCRIPGENLVGRVGFGFSHVAGAALDHGRYCVAWGSVGLAQACLEASLTYTSERKQFDAYLKEHQLIQRMAADMVVNTKAARLLCLNAGWLKDAGDPTSIMETSGAKYFASRIAMKNAVDAVQIHGANGCGDEYPVQRYMRDAKIMEIIEGSNEMQQLIIARWGYQNYTPGKEERRHERRKTES